MVVNSKPMLINFILLDMGSHFICAHGSVHLETKRKRKITWDTTYLAKGDFSDVAL